VGRGLGDVRACSKFSAECQDGNNESQALMYRLATSYQRLAYAVGPDAVNPRASGRFGQSSWQLERVRVDDVDRISGLEGIDLLVYVGELEIPLVFGDIADVRSGDDVGVLDVVVAGV
jgi:hypothetical protein